MVNFCVDNALSQNLENLESFPILDLRPKSVISGELSKNAYVWATQWPTSNELKIKFDLSRFILNWIFLIVKKSWSKNPHKMCNLVPKY